jgi:phage-related protein
MAEGFKIADGYLDIEADDSGAQRTLRGFLRRTDEILDANQKSFLRGGLMAGTDYGKSVTESADRELTNGFSRDINGRLHNARGRFASEGEIAGETFARGLTRGLGKLSGGSSGGGSDSSGRGGIFSSLFSGIGGAISSGLSGLSTAGGMIGNIGTALGAAGGIVSSIAMFVGITALIPVVIGLVGALIQLTGLLGLLPGLIGFAAAALIPLIIAFKGVGAALGAFMSGDMQKFNEELKKLGPGTRAVVKEMTGLVPILREIKKLVTEAFWTPFKGVFKDLGKTFLPMAKAGLVSVAGALGRFGSEFLRLFASNDIVEAIGDVFESTGRIIDKVGPKFINLFGTLIGIMEHSLPFVERFFSKIGSGMDKFSAFLSDAMKTGDFERWLETAFDVMQDLWDLSKALGNLFMAIFGDAGDEGQGFIKTLTDITNKMADFFRSPDGREFLQNILDMIKFVGIGLAFLAVAFANVARWWNAWTTFFESTLPDGLAKAKDAVTGLWGTVVGFFKGVGQAIGDFFSKAWDTVLSVGESIAGWFMALPGRVLGFLTALPGQLYTLFWDGFNRLGFAVGYGIGLIIVAVQALPGLVRGALSSMPGLVWGILTTTWSVAFSIVSDAVTTVLGFLWSLPTRAWDALNSLYGMVTGFFSRTKDVAVNQTRSMVDTVVGFAFSLPGRVMGALSGARHWLYNTGRDMLTGLWDGFSSMIGWLVDRVKGAMASVVNGAKSAVGARSPSKVFADQVGRWIPPGIQQGIEAQMPKLNRYMATLGTQMTHNVQVSAPAVSVGGSNVVVMLDGEEIGAKIMKPKRVSAANDEGNRTRGFLNTARATP